MVIAVAYLVFLVGAALGFAILPVRTAILATFLGGWVLLPVCHYPPPEQAGLFPWWITGTAVPSNILVDKAWIAPLAALIGGVARARDDVRRLRWSWLDLPITLWCLWPLVDGSLAFAARPAPWAAMLHVIGTWGVPWLLGRIWFADRAGRMLLLKALAIAGVACLPFAILEGVRHPALYGVFGQNHPFQFDGDVRYVGYRPIGFFEHGNQYGIWVALSALAACWVAASDRSGGAVWKLVAGVAFAIAIAAQSVGAIALLLLGLALLVLWQAPLVRPLLLIGIGCVLLLGLVHLSGLVPLQRLLNSGPGHAVYGLFRGVGRGSLLWRFSQDAKTLSGIHAHPLFGQAQWDWWRPFGTRPWGLILLLLGQYGVIGLLLAIASPVGAAGQAIARLRVASVWTADAAVLPLALIVLLAFADGLLNSFFYMPAFLLAGAIVRTRSSPTHRRPA